MIAEKSKTRNYDLFKGAVALALVIIIMTMSGGGSHAERGNKESPRHLARSHALRGNEVKLWIPAQ